MPPSPPRRSRLGLVALGAAVLLVVVTGGVAVGVWYGQGAPAPIAAVTTSPPTKTPATVAPDPLIVSGVLDLVDPDGRWKAGHACRGVGGFDDIEAGAEVVVTDRAGTVLAVSELFAGNGVKRSGVRSVVCAFAFIVTGVPTGGGIYGIEVSHRGVVHVNEADLAGDVMTLTLGKED